ncbi:hypothetical protein EGW08_015631 [Elysia chlorotica]|uniref:Uncharacterized protein n=1 Tax=Elysia chlorotica TaxID=188477 RepID=A0A3S0ZFU4_ELYCH|nr:hypothetical protein EGW08_015631 [Elysia chlorotica]
MKATWRGKDRFQEDLSVAIECLVGDFANQNSLGVFVCAPDWRMDEKRHLRVSATGSGLRVVTENFQEDLLLVVSHKRSLMEIYTILLTQPEKAQGRYRLLPDEQKPCFMDIAAEMAANGNSFLDHKSLSIEAKGRPTANLKIADEAPQLIVLERGQKSDDNTSCYSDIPFAYCVTPSASNVNKIASQECISKNKEGCHSDVPQQSPKSEEQCTLHSLQHEKRSGKEAHEEITRRTEQENQAELSENSSSTGDMFVSANNTLDGGNTIEDVGSEKLGTLDTGKTPQIRGVEKHSSLGGIEELPNRRSDKHNTLTACTPPACISIGSQNNKTLDISPSKFPRPRKTSTPSAQIEKMSKLLTPSHEVKISDPVGAKRATKLPYANEEKHQTVLISENFTSCVRPTGLGELEQTGLSLGSDDVSGLEQRDMSSGSLEFSSVSATPSDPSSARLCDRLFTTTEDQSNANECKTCSDGKRCQSPCSHPSEQHLGTLEQNQSPTCHPNNATPHKEPIEIHPPAQQVSKGLLRYHRADRSVDLEACLRSPEQRAVCIVAHQSSMCVRYPSEFATCTETDNDCV